MTPTGANTMYIGTFDHDKIISVFRRNIPGCYVRDYREQGGYITLCRDYKDIAWGGQTTTTPVYRSVPRVTLVSLPRGVVTRSTHYHGLALTRPGWQQEFRRASDHLSDVQMRRITHDLGAGEVFRGIV